MATQLVKITKWAGQEIEVGENPSYYGTLSGEEGHWPGFLSFEDFENWRDDYDTYHADLPNHSSWETISWDDLPPSIQSLESKTGGRSFTLKNHVDWMLEENNE